MPKNRFNDPETSNSGTPQENPIKEIWRNNRWSVLLIAAVVLVTLFFATCTTYVPPGQFAVKQVLYSPGKIFGPMGTQDKIYETGIHHQFPTFEKLLTFPKTLQVLTMRDVEQKQGLEAERAGDQDERFTRLAKAAYIQTSDGFFVKLDASILYRIEDPVKLVNRVGAGKLYEDNGILPVAENAIKQTLGSMQPEDFFISSNRVTKLTEAQALMNETLKPMGLKVDHVLARYPHLHPDVAARVEENNLQKQTKQLNMALTSLSAAEASLAQIVNQGLAAKGVALQKGQAYQVQRSSERELYERTRRAEGDKVRKMAEAQKSELLNKAYEGAGSDTLVAMKMAGTLSNLDTILIPATGPNALEPLNINSMVRLFGMETTNTLTKTK